MLFVYGLVLTVSGLLVQTGVVQASAHADHRALACTPASGTPGSCSGAYWCSSPSGWPKLDLGLIDRRKHGILTW